MATKEIIQIKSLEEMISPISPETLHALGITFVIIFILLFVSIILKGYAMWFSAKNGQKWWFISLFTINTMGILELIYLIFYRNKKSRKTRISSNQKTKNKKKSKTKEIEIITEINQTGSKEGVSK